VHPIWAWHMVPPVRSWLRMNKGKLPGIAAYVTVSGDTDPKKIVARWRRSRGGNQPYPPVLRTVISRMETNDLPRYNQDIIERFR